MSSTTSGRALHLRTLSGAGSIEMPEFGCIVAGYTGRDSESVKHHIRELAEIGVPAPPDIPMFYPMPAGHVNVADLIVVHGDNTSGEVEPVLIRHGGVDFLGVGSDHTERSLETVDIAESKSACPKPIGSTLIEIGEWASFDWDGCTMRSWVDGELYQSGSLSRLREPGGLLELMAERRGPLAGDLVCFAGTVPLLNGVFVAGTKWEIELELPDGSSIRHAYSTVVELSENR
jgi:Protein of unknown function (DUF2848)